MIDEEDRAARTVTLADTAPFDLASTADGAAIRRAMRLRKDPAIACFAIEMMRGTRSAVFTFRFTIDGEGKVVGLQEIDPQDEHRGIADCLWNILRIFHFPTSSPANFSYTFRFASNGKYKAPVRKPPPPPPPEVQRALEEYLRGLQGK